MNILTLSTKARTYSVALVSIVLLAASGPVFSATQADGQQLACQGTSSCGG